MGSGRMVRGDAHRPGRRGGVMSEHDVVVTPRWTSSFTGEAHRPGRRGGFKSEQDFVIPPWTSSIEASCVGDGQRAGNAGLCCCGFRKMLCCTFVLCRWAILVNALAVALDCVELEGGNTVGRLEGVEHSQRASWGWGWGGWSPQVALPIPDAGPSSPHRKLVLLRWRIDEKEELDTETPNERWFDESFLSKRTVSFNCPNETFRWLAQTSEDFHLLGARKEEPCELRLREPNEFVLEKERSRFNLARRSREDMFLFIVGGWNGEKDARCCSVWGR